MSKKHGTKYLFKMFPHRGGNVGGLKTLNGESDSSGSIDSRPSRGRPRIACTTAKIDKIKDLALIFLKVTLRFHSLSGNYN